MQELDHCRKLTVLKTNGTRRVGKRKLSWLESAEEDVKNWRRKAQDREQMRAFVEEATVHQGLQCQKKEEEEEEEKKKKKKKKKNKKKKKKKKKQKKTQYPRRFRIVFPEIT